MKFEIFSGKVFISKPEKIKKIITITTIKKNTSVYNVSAGSSIKIFMS